MPSPEKAERRERKRLKAIDSKYQNVRYRTLRSGESLAKRQAESKTLLEGKRVRRVKRR